MNNDLLFLCFLKCCKSYLLRWNDIVFKALLCNSIIWNLIIFRGKNVLNFLILYIDPFPIKVNLFYLWFFIEYIKWKLIIAVKLPFLSLGNIVKNRLYIRCYYGTKKIWWPSTRMDRCTTGVWSWGKHFFQQTLFIAMLEIMYQN